MKAENARAFRTDSKAENARAFVIGNKEPRTPVLFANSEKIRMSVAENTRASSSRIGSGLDCSVPGRFILAARLRSGGRAKRRLSNAWRRTQGARRVARTLGAEGARCGRRTRGAVCARCGREARAIYKVTYVLTYNYFTRHIIYTIYT